MNLRDIAVTVRALPGEQYGWVLMEGTGEQGTFASYAMLRESESLYRTYSTAMAAGFAALRSMFGADGPRRGGTWEPDSVSQPLV